MPTFYEWLQEHPDTQLARPRVGTSGGGLFTGRELLAAIDRVGPIDGIEVLTTGDVWVENDAVWTTEPNGHVAVHALIASPLKAWMEAHPNLRLGIPRQTHWGIAQATVYDVWRADDVAETGFGFEDTKDLGDALIVRDGTLLFPAQTYHDPAVGAIFAIAPTVGAVLKTLPKNQVLYSLTPPHKPIGRVRDIRARLAGHKPEQPADLRGWPTGVLDWQTAYNEQEKMWVYDPVTDERVFLCYLQMPRPQTAQTPAWWRSDARLIRHISDRWPDTGRAWAHLDLIWAQDISAQAMKNRDTLKRDVASLHWLPFDDFILDHGCSMRPVAVEGSGRVRDEDIYIWQRVTRGRIWKQRMVRYDPWKDNRPPVALISDDGIVLETHIWIQRLGERGWEGPSYAVIDPDQWMIDTRVLVPEGLSSLAEDSMREQAWFGVACLAYLAWGPEYLTLVTPTPHPAAKHQKGDAKPWTAQRPHYRVLHPRTTIWRPRGERSADASLSHVRHHHRAGCVATLLHRRYYQWPHSEDIIGNPIEAPTLTEYAYQDTDHLAGIDASHRPHIYRRVGSLWQELQVRHVNRREAWAGVKEGEDDQGNTYRVRDDLYPAKGDIA